MHASRPGRATPPSRPLASTPPIHSPGPASPSALRISSRPGGDPLVSPETHRWEGDRSVRPLRGGPLRDILDAEFRRCHRFDTLSSFFGDLRSLLRKAIVREDDAAELERFLPGR